MAQLYESSFQTIEHDEANSLLTLIWKTGTKEMNYPQFQGALFIFAGYAQQKNPQKCPHRRGQLLLRGYSGSDVGVAQ